MTHLDFLSLYTLQAVQIKAFQNPVPNNNSFTYFSESHWYQVSFVETLGLDGFYSRFMGV